MSDAGELLVQRASKHGDFTHGAQFTQDVLDALTVQPNWYHLRAFEKEGIHMIVHKMQRVMVGDHNYDDHWLDVEGYARCVRERLHLTDHSAMTVLSADPYNDLAISIMGVFRRQPNWHQLSPLQAESCKNMVLALTQWVSGRQSGPGPWLAIETSARRVFNDLQPKGSA